MDTKEIALTIIFTAVAIALNPVQVPAFFMANWNFRFFEIPVVAAFLLLGPKIGVTVAVLRTLGEMTLFPGPVGPLIPLWGLLIDLSMLLGIYFAGWLLKRKTSQDKNLGTRQVTYFTAFGTLIRAPASTLLMSATYYFLQILTEAQIIALMPFFAITSVILSLYTIPAGYLIARIVSRNLNVGNKL